VTGWWVGAAGVAIALVVLGSLVAGALRRAARLDRSLDRWRADLGSARAALRLGAASIRARRAGGPGADRL
jgi:hypothetical protein